MYEFTAVLVFDANFDGRKCVFGTGAVVGGLGTEGQGGGVQKLKTPNVYYYPVCSGLAFRGESPAVTLGPTAQLPPRCTSPLSSSRLTLRFEMLKGE